METHDKQQPNEIALIQKNQVAKCWNDFQRTSTQVSKVDLKLYSTANLAIGLNANPLSQILSIKESIEKIAVVYFGIRSGLLDNHLLDSVVKTIRTKFLTLSPEDLVLAFERIEIKKDGWNNLTKSDIITPIQNWWNQKEKIRLEFESFRIEEEKNSKNEFKDLEFRNKSIEIYRESVRLNHWSGDVFNAHAIAKRYIAAQIQQEIKTGLWIQAQRDYKEAGAIAEEEAKHRAGIELTPAMIGISALRIFSELIVKKGIELKIEI
jgi:hypothetical protein